MDRYYDLTQATQNLLPSHISSYREITPHVSMSIDKEFVPSQTQEKEFIIFDLSYKLTSEANLIQIGLMSCSSIIERTLTGLGSTNSHHAPNNSLLKIASMLKEDKNNPSILSRVVFSPHIPTEYKLSKSRTLCYIKCNVISTYFVDNYYYSYFTNPKNLETDPRVNVKVVLQEEFNETTAKSLLLVSIHKIDLSSLETSKLVEFFNELNSLGRNQEIIDINKRLDRKKLLYIVMAIVTLIIVVLGVILTNYLLNSYDDADKSLGFWFAFILILILLLLLFCIMLKFIGVAFVDVRDIRCYEVNKAHIRHFPNVEALFDKWNISTFLPNFIFVSCPVNLSYLIFNLDPFKEIELENHKLKS